MLMTLNYFFTLDSQSLQIILKVRENFSEYSTLKLNVEKSQACWIGSAKGRISKPADCNCVDLLTDKVITLSIYNCYDKSIAERHNLVNLLINIKDSLKMWNFRELTLSGKIQIFKSLALLKTVYVCTMISPSRQFLDQLNLLKRNFIWAGKSAKIRHSTLIVSCAEGGYKDVDIESKLKSLKIIWIKRLLDDNFHPWKIIPNKLFSFTGTSSVFCQNFKQSRYCAEQFSSFPKFYQELILFWENVCTEQPKDFQDIINQFIWNNKFILRDGDSIFYPSLHWKGLLYIRDLLDETGSFLNWSIVKEKFSLRNENYYI